MEINKAILTFSQSEKIKAGLTWVSHTLGLLQGLSDEEKKGAVKVIEVLINMIVHETRLAKTVGVNGGWDEVESFVDRAMVMIHSGVGEEAIIHLSKALSKTTNYGQESMSLLQEKGLL